MTAGRSCFYCSVSMDRFPLRDNATLWSCPRCPYSEYHPGTRPAAAASAPARGRSSTDPLAEDPT